MRHRPGRGIVSQRDIVEGFSARLTRCIDPERVGTVCVPPTSWIRPVGRAPLAVRVTRANLGPLLRAAPILPSDGVPDGRSTPCGPLRRRVRALPRTWCPHPRRSNGTGRCGKPWTCARLRREPGRGRGRGCPPHVGAGVSRPRHEDPHRLGELASSQNFPKSCVIRRWRYCRRWRRTTQPRARANLPMAHSTPGGPGARSRWCSGRGSAPRTTGCP